MPAESLFITGGAGMIPDELEGTQRRIPPPTVLEENWLDDGNMRKMEPQIVDEEQMERAGDTGDHFNASKY